HRVALAAGGLVATAMTRGPLPARLAPMSRSRSFEAGLSARPRTDYDQIRLRELGPIDMPPLAPRGREPSDAEICARFARGDIVGQRRPSGAAVACCCGIRLQLGGRAA